MAAHLVRAMEVLHVVFVDVRGADIRAAAEPPLFRHSLPLLCLKVAVVEVHGGRVRVLGVHHTADAGREEGHTVGWLL